jgi:NAD dependent epimerase/dehydratase family enzyme
MDDAVSGILYILGHHKIKGAVNLAAPNPVTNKAFSKTLARVFSKKLFFTLPKFLAVALWGDMGKETLLTSARVKPEKLLNNGFSFQHETLVFALKDMLGR